MNRPELNVTPPTKPASFGARIPSEPKNDSPSNEHPDTIVVSYGLNGVVKINRETPEYSLTDPTPISARLTEIFQMREENANFERTVFIKAPTSAAYGDVALMIDTVKAGGAEPISLQIDELE